MASGPPPGGSFLIEAPAGQILTPESLDSDARMMAHAAADFMRGEVLPAADRLQEHEPGLMPSLLRKSGELGFLGLEIPQEYGGLGLPRSTSARIAEALAVEPSFAVSHNVHTSVATLPIILFGNEDQKRRWLPKLASGEWLGAYALSEAHAGSDALAARTRATPSGDSYLLTGEKMWITNAGFADLFVVFGRIDGDEKLTAFVVERDMAGLSIGREEHKLGLKGSSTCRVILDSVRLPAANLLGHPGDGAKVALHTLNLGRFKVAASSVGQSKNLLGIATRYSKQRTAFGKPICEFGLIQEKLARMAARIFACESMLYRVAGYLDTAFEHGESLARAQRLKEDTPASINLAPHPAAEYAIECSLLKVACTETLDYCADECLQIHGGYGYTEEFPAARAWRDARVNRIYEGTNEINRVAAVAMLLKRIDLGRIDVRLGPNTSETAADQAELLRALLASIIRHQREVCPDLLEQQTLCAAIADMMIALLADESMNLRARLMVESGRPERIYLSAFASRRTVLNLNVAAIVAAGVISLAALQSIVPSLNESTTADLARAVIEAEGYIW